MTHRRIEFEDVLRWMALAGAGTLVGAVLATTLGLATKTLAPYDGSTLPFLFAVLVVTAPYAELLEVRARRLRRMSVDERLGFVPHDAPAH
jgi:hypothetical protein